MKHTTFGCARLLAGSWAALLFGACTQVRPEADFERARQLVRETTGLRDVYDPKQPALSPQEIAEMLGDGLSLDEALRLCLLNNRRLQAEFMSIGVAKADWVQSGLLTNPSLDLLVRFPLDGARSQIEGFLVQNLLELWRIPTRKEISQHELDATVLRIARQAGELVAETRIAYYDAVARQELHEVAIQNLQNATASHEAVRAMVQAGAASRFDESLARGPLLQARLAVRSAELDAREARRRLSRRLSLDAQVETLVLSDPLPEPQAGALEPEALVSLARESRLDLRAQREAIAAAGARIELETGSGIGELSAGAGFERPPVSGDTTVGPALTATLPIFDQNQAQIARAEYLYAQAHKAYEAATLEVAQEVRGALDRLNTASSSLDFYRDELLPQARENLRFANESYSAGQTSVLALLEAQGTFLEVRIGLIETRREAVAAMAELERAVGVPLANVSR